jgi:type IV pilus assembly protein PilV
MIRFQPQGRCTRFKPPHTSTFRLQRGVGLIEVLVAVLILALGMLGMAGLQSKSLRASQSSYARSQAVMLSYYMMDAMRADRKNAIALAYNIDTLCKSDSLTTNTLPNNNRKHWIDNMRKSLGDSETTCGTIGCDASGLCTVKVIWNDERAGGLGEQTFETQSRL